MSGKAVDLAGAETQIGRADYSLYQKITFALRRVPKSEISGGRSPSSGAGTWGFRLSSLHLTSPLSPTAQTQPCHSEAALVAVTVVVAVEDSVEEIVVSLDSKRANLDFAP